MSWAEVKKINSDLSTPLNVLQTINNIDLFGDSGINLLADIDVGIELIQNNTLFAHPIAANTVLNQFFDIVLASSSGNIGKYINKAFKCNSSALAACETYIDIINNEAAAAALGASEKFFHAMSYINDRSMYADLFDNSGALIQNSREALYSAMKSNGDVVGYMRDNETTWTALLSHTEQFLTRSSHEWISDMNGTALIVAVGAGYRGNNGGEAGSSLLGSAGVYTQFYKTLNENDVVDGTISATSTSSTFLNIDLGPGGGTLSGHVPEQYGKILKTASIVRNGGGGSTGCYSKRANLLFLPEGGRPVPTVLCANYKGPGFTRTLNKGARGNDVKVLQTILGCVEVDGVYGPNTKAAVKKAQIALKMQKPDGICGPLTRKAMGLDG